MRAYLALARISARSILAYRMNFVLGLFSLLFQLLAMLSIWGVLLRSGRDLGGFTWPEMKAYLLIAYGTGALVSSYGDFRLAGRIRDGTVAIDLTKPVDFQRARFAETIGQTLMETLSTVVVCAGVVALAGGVAIPPTPAQAVLFLLSVLIVVPLKFSVVYLATLTCFWTQNILGVSWTRLAVTNLFSGALVPLSFLPGWLQAMAAVLPFASITFTPAQIYLGHATGTAAIQLIGVQAGWAVALWFASRLAWRGAVRQLTVHGG